MVMQARFELGTTEADLAEGVLEDFEANRYHQIDKRGATLYWENGYGRCDRLNVTSGEYFLHNVQHEVRPTALIRGGNNDRWNTNDVYGWTNRVILHENRGEVAPIFELERLLKCPPPKLHLAELYADGVKIDETDRENDFTKECRREVDTFFSQYLEVVNGPKCKLGKPFLEELYRCARKGMRPFPNYSEPPPLQKIFGAQLLAQLENAYGKITQW